VFGTPRVIEIYAFGEFVRIYFHACNCIRIAGGFAEPWWLPIYHSRDTISQISGPFNELKSPSATHKIPNKNYSQEKGVV
jgi:hypothetical protein